MINDKNTHYSIMLEAFKEAEIALSNNTYPVGSVIVNENNLIISKDRNNIYPNYNYTEHAEIIAINKALSLKQDYLGLERCTIYVTLEPCLMCFGAILMSRLARIVWALNDSKYGATKLTVLLDTYPNISKISLCGEPFPDLKLRQETIMNSWKEKYLKVVGKDILRINQ